MSARQARALFGFAAIGNLLSLRFNAVWPPSPTIINGRSTPQGATGRPKLKPRKLTVISRIGSTMKSAKEFFCVWQKPKSAMRIVGKQS